MSEPRQLDFFGPYWTIEPEYALRQVGPPPAGERCFHCGKVFEPEHRGVRLPGVGFGGRPRYRYFHALCWLVVVAGASVARQAQRDSPQLAEEPFPDA